MSTAPTNATTAAHWSHFPHSADLGVRGVGSTVDSAFEQAALALFAAVTDVDRVVPAQEIEIACTAPDLELLLVDWLNALIYEAGTRGLVFGKFAVEIEGHSLRAHAWGEPVDPRRHSPAVEPKGATLTELCVAHAPGGAWIAQCVVDV